MQSLVMYTKKSLSLNLLSSFFLALSMCWSQEADAKQKSYWKSLRLTVGWSSSVSELDDRSDVSSVERRSVSESVLAIIGTGRPGMMELASVRRSLGVSSWSDSV